MSESIEYLDLDDVLELAALLLGASPPIRDLGLLGSAVARPQATAFGEDAYPDLITKGALRVEAGWTIHVVGRGLGESRDCLTVRAPRRPRWGTVVQG